MQFYNLIIEQLINPEILSCNNNDFTQRQYANAFSSICWFSAILSFKFLRMVLNWLHVFRIQYESYITEFQMTRNWQNREIQIAGFAPTRLIIFFLHADWLER